MGRRAVVALAVLLGVALQLVLTQPPSRPSTPLKRRLPGLLGTDRLPQGQLGLRAPAVPIELPSLARPLPVGDALPAPTVSYDHAVQAAKRLRIAQSEAPFPLFQNVMESYLIGERLSQEANPPGLRPTPIRISMVPRQPAVMGDSGPARRRLGCVLRRALLQRPRSFGRPETHCRSEGGGIPLENAPSSAPSSRQAEPSRVAENVSRGSASSLPWLAMTAVAVLLTYAGFRVAAIKLVTQFRTYIRPGVCDMLRVGQIVWPSAQSAHQVYHLWGIVLHPFADAVPSKTGRFDDAIWLDLDLWLGPLLGQLAQGKQASDFLWPISPRGLIHLFRESCRLLHLLVLRPCRHARRHGGASDDLVTKTRNLGEVKRLGCWSSDASLTRYGKEAALLQQLKKVPPKVVAYGDQMAKILPKVLSGEVACPPPPVARLQLEALVSYKVPLC